MYNKILVPHAGTDAGSKALFHAQKIAKMSNSEVTILHIVERIPEPSLITFNYEKAKWRADLQKARGEMKEQMHDNMEKIAEVLKKEGISYSIKVVEGYPDEEIARIANSDHYDLIVMAKRRKLRGVKAILKLGSISRKLLEQVSTPVLLIDGEK